MATVSPGPSASTLTPSQIQIDNAAQAQYPNLAPYPGLLAGIEQTESGGNLNASNPSGATGPFQFLPSTAAQYGLTVGPGGTVYDQSAAANAAAAYLSANVAQYGNVDTAVLQYSGGLNAAGQPNGGGYDYSNYLAPTYPSLVSDDTTTSTTDGSGNVITITSGPNSLSGTLTPGSAPPDTSGFDTSFPPFDAPLGTTGGYDTTSGGTPGTQAGSPTGVPTGGGSALPSISNVMTSVYEVIKRGGVILLGVGLILLVLFFLFAEAAWKEIEVPVGSGKIKLPPVEI